MLVLTPVITPLSSLMSGLLESLNFPSSSLPDWILHFVAADVDVDDGVKEDPGAGDLVDRVGELRGDEVPGVPHDQVQQAGSHLAPPRTPGLSESGSCRW